MYFNLSPLSTNQLNFSRISYHSQVSSGTGLQALSLTLAENIVVSESSVKTKPGRATITLKKASSTNWASLVLTDKVLILMS